MSYEEIQSLAGTVGLVCFLLAFAGVVFYALRPKNREVFDRASRSPLNED